MNISTLSYCLFSSLNPPPTRQNQKVCQNQKVQGKIELYQRQRLHRRRKIRDDDKKEIRVQPSVSGYGIR